MLLDIHNLLIQLWKQGAETELSHTGHYCIRLIIDRMIELWNAAIKILVTNEVTVWDCINDDESRRNTTLSGFKCIVSGYLAEGAARSE